MLTQKVTTGMLLPGFGLWALPFLYCCWWHLPAEADGLTNLPQPSYLVKSVFEGARAESSHNTFEFDFFIFA